MEGGVEHVGKTPASFQIVVGYAYHLNAGYST
jgi:hypothetical protein